MKRNIIISFIFFLYIIIFINPTYSQNPYTPVFPPTAITDTQIYVASSNAFSVLTVAMGTGDTTMTVAAASTFKIGNLCLIDNEKIIITAIVGAVSGGYRFTISRAGDFSTAATHAVGRAVNNVIAPGPVNRANREIESIENDLVNPYRSTITTQTGVTINASTHAKGIYAYALCFDNLTPANIRPCSYTRDGSGNLVFAFNPAWSGVIEIRR